MSNDTTTRLDAFVADVTAACHAEGAKLTSVILFGSVVTGGHAGVESDVDMILVLAHAVTAARHASIRERVAALEVAHGFRPAATTPEAPVQRLARALTANGRSFFICTRDDLLSGDPARILGITPLQAAFVDRVVVPSIVGSARTAWGEDLLTGVRLQPIRRVDVLKAWFSQWNQVMLCAALYPLVPQATKYAMSALKRSLHNCYFCCQLRSAPLADEVAFFRRHRVGGPVLDELLSLRAAPRPSLLFVLRCLPALVALHAWTATRSGYPKRVPTPDA